MHPTHIKRIPSVPCTCFAATFQVWFLDLKASVSLSLQGMLVLDAGGKLLKRIISTWLLLLPELIRVQHFLWSACVFMFLDWAGHNKRWILLLPSASDTDNQTCKMLAIARKVWFRNIYFDTNIPMSCTHLCNIAKACRTGNASNIKNAILDSIVSSTHYAYVECLPFAFVRASDVYNKAMCFWLDSFRHA